MYSTHRFTIDQVIVKKIQYLLRVYPLVKVGIHPFPILISRQTLCLSGCNLRLASKISSMSLGPGMHVSNRLSFEEVKTFTLLSGCIADLSTAQKKRTTREKLNLRYQSQINRNLLSKSFIVANNFLNILE